MLTLQSGQVASEVGIRAKSLDAILAEVKTRYQNKIDSVEELAPKQYLPAVSDWMRAMPNHIARSSLFAPVARGKKKVHKDSILISRGDVVIKFSGEQLDESQADVWMQAMHQAIAVPLGEPVVITRATFLRSIGRQTGNYEYKWLHRSMEALCFAMLVVEVIRKHGKPNLTIGKTRAMHMLEGFEYCDVSETYSLTIDPRWREMYLNREFALVDWQKRMQFSRHQDMAKAMQRLILSSKDCVQYYSMAWLKRKLEYTGRDRDFNDALKKSMLELERLAIVARWIVGLSTKGNLQLTMWLS